MKWCVWVHFWAECGFLKDVLPFLIFREFDFDVAYLLSCSFMLWIFSFSFLVNHPSKQYLFFYLSYTMIFIPIKKSVLWTDNLFFQKILKSHSSNCFFFFSFSGWFARDPSVLCRVGDVLLKLNSVEPKRARRVIFADDLFQLSKVPMQKTVYAISKTIENLSGCKFLDLRSLIGCILCPFIIPDKMI